MFVNSATLSTFWVNVGEHLVSCTGAGVVETAREGVTRTVIVAREDSPLPLSSVATSFKCELYPLYVDKDSSHLKFVFVFNGVVGLTN